MTLLTGIGVVIVLAGVPVYFLMKKSSSSTVAQKCSGKSRLKSKTRKMHLTTELLYLSSDMFSRVCVALLNVGPVNA